VDHPPGSIGALQSVLMDSQLGTGFESVRHAGAPHSYNVRPPVDRPWVKLAMKLEKISSNYCVTGDKGRLLHQVAFEQGSDLRFDEIGVLLGIFRRAEDLMRNRVTMKELTPEFDNFIDRMHSVTMEDLQILTVDFWRCMALGCAGCTSVALSGLCMKDLEWHVRRDLLTTFLVMLRVDVSFFTRWFQLLGIEYPPPFGWVFSRKVSRSFFNRTEKPL